MLFGAINLVPCIWFHQFDGVLGVLGEKDAHGVQVVRLPVYTPLCRCHSVGIQLLDRKSIAINSRFNVNIVEFQWRVNSWWAIESDWCFGCCCDSGYDCLSTIASTIFTTTAIATLSPLKSSGNRRDKRDQGDPRAVHCGNGSKIAGKSLEIISQWLRDSSNHWI